MGSRSVSGILIRRRKIDKIRFRMRCSRSILGVIPPAGVYGKIDLHTTADGRRSHM